MERMVPKQVSWLQLSSSSICQRSGASVRIARSVVVVATEMMVKLTKSALEARIHSTSSAAQQPDCGVQAFIGKRAWDDTRHTIKVPLLSTNPALQRLIKLAKSMMPIATKQRPAARAMRQLTFKRAHKQVKNKLAKRGAASLASHKVKLAVNAMAQRLWVRWGSKPEEGDNCILPHVLLEAQTASNMLEAMRATTPCLSLLQHVKPVVQAVDGRLWYCLILRADSARATGKLMISLWSQASECPSLMFLDQMRCAPRAQVG